MLPVSLSTLSNAAKAALVLGAVLLLAAVAGLSAWRGYEWGYGVAESKGRAELGEYRASVEKASALAADTARKVLDAEIVRRDSLEQELSQALSTIKEQRRRLTKKEIAHASHDVAVADGTCVLGPDWLCLYNQALGLGDGDRVPGAAAGVDAGAGQAGAADPGVLRQGGGVTPADILAHARDVGRYMEELRARYQALVAWAEGLPRSQAVTGSDR